MTCVVCGSEKHFYCSTTPLKPIEPNSPEDNLLSAIFGETPFEEVEEHYEIRKKAESEGEVDGLSFN